MAPPPALTLLIDSPPPGIATANLEISYDPSPPRIPGIFQAYIEERWSHYLADAEAHGKSLTNGPVTRLIAAGRFENTVHLQVGPTDYKTFVVTTLRDRPWFEQNAPHCICRALGNSALVTHQDWALVGVRSPRVSAYAGRAHLIGGVLDRLATEALPATAAGILTHLRHELDEEAHLKPEDLATEPRLLALVRDEFLGQPELIWHCELRQDVREVARRPGDAEHTQWLLLPKQGVDAGLWEQLTPVARAAWERWSRRP